MEGNLSSIAAIITNVGYPIVVSLIVAKFYKDYLDKAENRAIEREDRLIENNKLLAEALKQNSECTKELNIKVDKIDDKVNEVYSIVKPNRSV